jgi:t-SNARE complex subunit (syntaxin)
MSIIRELKEIENRIDLLQGNIHSDIDHSISIKSIKSSLEKLQGNINDLRKTEPVIAQNIYASFKHIVAKYVKLNTDYKKIQSDKLIARGTIIFGMEKEDEIKKMVNENPVEFVAQLSRAIKEPLSASPEAISVYSDALSRNSEINRLVHSITEVSDMMKWLSILIQEQSEKLDSIETHIEVAGKYVKAGNNNLKTTIDVQKKNRKCYCYLFCVFIIVAIIAISLGTGLGVKML